MTTLFMTIVGIIAAILTLWLVVIPVDLVAGAFTAFRHGGRDGKGPNRLS